VQHVSGRTREEERLVAIVIPSDDVVLVAAVEEHVEDFALPRRGARPQALNDELVSDVSVHPDLPLLATR